MFFTYITNKIGGYNQLRSIYFKTNYSIIRKACLFLNKGLQIESNSYLPFDNTISGPLNLPHGNSGIFISGSAVIGKNCTIYQQVTIGSNTLISSKKFGSPIIGDNCILGAGAKIIGKVKIGNNCRIGANAFVNQDIPDNSTVISGSQVIVGNTENENKIYQLGEQGWGYLSNGKFITETDKTKIEILCSKRN